MCFFGRGFIETFHWIRMLTHAQRFVRSHCETNKLEYWYVILWNPQLALYSPFAKIGTNIGWLTFLNIVHSYAKVTCLHFTIHCVRSGMTCGVVFVYVLPSPCHSTRLRISGYKIGRVRMHKQIDAVNHRIPIDFRSPCRQRDTLSLGIACQRTSPIREWFWITNVTHIVLDIIYICRTIRNLCTYI